MLLGIMDELSEAHSAHIEQNVNARMVFFDFSLENDCSVKTIGNPFQLTYNIVNHQNNRWE